MRNFIVTNLSAVAAASVLLLPAMNASAHERGYTDYRSSGPAAHYAYRRAAMPRWLRRHRDFTRWYKLNYHRVRAGAGWHRLYRRYERDYFYHRHYKSKHRAAHKSKRKNRDRRRHRHDHD